jgi:hypothetical protein
MGLSNTSSPTFVARFFVRRTHPTTYRWKDMDRGGRGRDQIPMKPKPLVLSRSDFKADRLLLIRTLQGYNKATNSPRRRAEQDQQQVCSIDSFVHVLVAWWWWTPMGDSLRIE